MTRKKMIVGNWKMNKTPDEAVILTKQIGKEIDDIDSQEVIVGIAPSLTSIDAVSKVISKKIILCAQNMFYEEEGAYTGETSPKMLKSLGCDGVIIGHSERRHIFNESDEMINKKVRKAIIEGLQAILCIGETKEERDDNKVFDVNKTQLVNGLKDVSKEDMKHVVIAYEPVWAIGTGVTATKEQAQEVHAFIRDELKELYDEETAQDTTILYGGSVKPSNVKELVAQPDIDGGLIGGASLKADDFIGIIKNSA